MILAEECCKECFKNEYIQDWIRSNGDFQNEECVYCNNIESYFIKLDQLGEYFRNTINSVYRTQAEVYNSDGPYWAELYDYDTLIDVLVDYDVFSNKISNLNNQKKLFEDLLEESEPSVRDIASGSEDNLNDGIYTDVIMAESDIKGEYFLNWSKFKYISKHVNRYFDMPNNCDSTGFSHLESLTPDSKRESMLSVYQSYFDKMTSILPVGTTIFRARNFEINYPIPSIIDEGVCGPPPSNRARSMRMNPDGISYCYAAVDKDTCLKEVRAKQGDRIIVGEFATIKELKVVDFTKFPDELTDIFHPKYNHNERLELEFLEEFQREISIPYSPADSHIEYIPTQVLTEYIRYLGYDGIKFNSSLTANNSVNYLFFCGNANEDPGYAYKDLLPPKVIEWFKMITHKLIVV